MLLYILTKHRPSPVYGVIFLFRYPTGEKSQETPLDGSYDYEAADDHFFAAQTIQNACGTQALLSVLLNKTDGVEIGPRLQEFKDFTGAFPADVGTFRPRAVRYLLRHILSLQRTATGRSALKLGAYQRCSQLLR